MRRKDREITDLTQIKEIMEACSCCHLGLSDEKYPYIVPLNFGFKEENGRFTLYFHGAKEGRKIELIRKHPDACFEMETGYALKKDELACNHSAAFQSIIGEGTVTLLGAPEEKKEGLRQIMLHNTGKADWDFPDKMLETTCVIKFEVAELACKVHE